jgi:hypothetical protein
MSKTQATPILLEDIEIILNYIYMQKYPLTFRICNNNQKLSKYVFSYAHMHFKKIRALLMTQSERETHVR